MKKVIIFLFILSFLSYVIISLSNWQIQYRKTFQKISPADSLSGNIIALEFPRGGTMVTLNDNKKYYFLETENGDYYHSTLSSFLNIGDSIYKSNISDTLFVSRNNNKYFFILYKSLHKEKINPFLQTNKNGIK